MEKQNNNKGVIALLIVIIIILATLCILFATGTINLNDKEVANDNSNQNVNNEIGNNVINNEQPEQNNTIYDDAIAENILGTYYNSDDNKNYFTLKVNGKGDYASVDCNTGNVILKEEVSYRIITNNDAIILEIDINNNGEFNRSLIGSKYDGSNYKFRSTVPGCNDMENTYYTKK